MRTAKKFSQHFVIQMNELLLLDSTLGLVRLLLFVLFFVVIFL